MSVIAVVGTGYVGLVTGACFADLGNDVTCVDIDAGKVAALQAGAVPIYEPGLTELVGRNARAGRLRFTAAYAAAVPGAEFCFITVDTPEGASGQANMGAVRAAAGMIGAHLRGHTVVINKSTMPIGSGDLVAGILAPLAAAAGATVEVVSNPEFLREGSAIADFLRPDRVVLGSAAAAAAGRVAELYAPLGAPTLITDLRTAEMIKYASNAFLATRVSFINEVAQICERLGADVRAVAEGMGLDRRIGRHFLEAGVGFGGSCFPKDVRALAYMAEATDCHPQLLHAVLEINEAMRRRFVLKVERLVGELHGARVGAWGLAFKPDTDDMREAPAVGILRGLAQRGARVTAYDPVAMAKARVVLPEVEYADGAYAAAEGADALVVLTPWNEFKQADLGRVARSMRRPVLVDGRNLYDPAEARRHGFLYAGVGTC